MAVIWEGATSRRRRRGSYSQQHRPIFVVSIMAAMFVGAG